MNHLHFNFFLIEMLHCVFQSQAEHSLPSMLHRRQGSNCCPMTWWSPTGRMEINLSRKRGVDRSGEAGPGDSTKRKPWLGKGCLYVWWGIPVSDLWSQAQTCFTSLSLHQGSCVSVRSGFKGYLCTQLELPGEDEAKSLSFNNAELSCPGFSRPQARASS